VTEQLEPMPSGPFLAAAVLCEKVLQEQGGVASLIRIVDRHTIRTIGPEAPQEMPAARIDWSLVLIFKAGAARGRAEVKLTIEAPSGLRLGDEIHLPVLFEGDDRGVQLVAQLGLELREEGLYWIDVRLDGRPVTRVPLRLVYERLAGPATRSP
jgi:hypothetical protein